eukprot:CAMPEP_0198523358 /NCGR_PEP_ID=MMETSP1462-20131121/22093_1 /TAXON_ID=1333877 /ORGANISM="Brandtodinium nutriculum, Strain RCC3387" /LENGTH=142 /DNA_ID=CAMNT_0044253055 /DNA_START=68 /DNA_END=494 /DNA_ORIENTATION=+
MRKVGHHQHRGQQPAAVLAHRRQMAATDFSGTAESSSGKGQSGSEPLPDRAGDRLRDADRLCLAWPSAAAADGLHMARPSAAAAAWLPSWGDGDRLLFGDLGCSVTRTWISILGSGAGSGNDASFKSTKVSSTTCLPCASSG